MFIKKITNRQMRNAQSTLGNDEGAIIMRITNKIEHTPLKKIKLAKAVLGRKHFKFHHIVQWEQKYKKIPL